MYSSRWCLSKPRLVSVVIALSFPVFCFANATLQNSSVMATSTIISLTNIDRGALGLDDLRSNNKLEKAAQLKANDMASRGYFSHNTPEGKKPWYWFKLAGYNFNYAGENLAVNFSKPSDMENAWMNSPGHKANIVNVHFKEIGIGIAYGTYNGQPATFVVELFGAEPVKAVATR